ncbi:outer membrane transport energization protein TonB [Stanieria cyanosphaera PCC 7437]|uniref:Outer membrane transport energization protein TonB n=1 Tax=Stanieria cyanosphaera (strain ATCC 29371 / PCC 7437) TaxID=111780 RepID=K9XY49_STAC7|nr:energy transducer TonB [Stanieria cyanosphaera]AFZ36562.1 outer membrane transport energization protein TonB [Stanieria cyanosphaera PCC 7437]
MSTSNFCFQKRQQEQRQLKKLLTVGFAGSVLFHGLLALTLPNWSVEPPKAKEKPVDLIVVEKPKPKPPETKIEPKPIPKPEPVKPQPTPPPAVKQPEPVKPQPTPPKPQPATKRVLTSPTPAPSQPVISGAIEDTSSTSSLSRNFIAGNSTNSGSSDSGSGIGIPGAVAANSSAPPRPEPSTDEKITCVSNCEPEYPSALNGIEGSAGIKLNIDAEGNVTSAVIDTANSNSELNRQALLAARQMKFSSPSNGSNASVKVNINFTVAGSDFDRQARQQELERERLAEERREQEEARQQQLEQERQARQEQLEQERQSRMRQQQLEQQQQTEIEKPPQVQQQQQQPTTSETEREDEMLRKFRDRIERHQQQ